MKIKAIFSYLFKTVVPALAVSAFVIFAVAPVGCNSGLPGITLLSGDYEAPTLSAFTVTGSDSLSLDFDKDVQLLHAVVRDDGGRELGVSAADAGGGRLLLTLAERTVLGVSYTLTGDVADGNGNTLTFSVTFPGYNDNMARLLLAEVRNAYSSKKNQYEFVKLYCLTGGNLSGYELLSAGDGEKQKYVFPPLEVRQGDYVTVHLRMMRGEDGSYCQQGMVDELDGDITASTAVDAAADSWDLWVDNQKSRLAPSDIIVLRKDITGEVVDALPFVDPRKEASDWDRKYDAVCRAVRESGVWLDAGGAPSSAIGAAVQAAGITSSATGRTLLRRNVESHAAADAAQKVTASAADWYVKNYSQKK